MLNKRVALAAIAAGAGLLAQTHSDDWTFLRDQRRLPGLYLGIE
jgi:hypothetical protein